MKNLLLAFLLTALNTAAFAQIEIAVPGPDGETAFTFHKDVADPLIRQLPRDIANRRQSDPAGFIKLLAEYINEKSVNDYDRIKKAHDWVALNIRYDTQSYFSGNYSSQRANDVIRRGNAVCAGYADVFKMLCDALEIECIVVSGYARGHGRNMFDSENNLSDNHAWNIVTINGKKYLLDTTWDAGYLNGRNFVTRYKTDYLFTDPAAFIHDHFPQNSIHQLLDPPVSADAFRALPFLDPSYFHMLEKHPGLPRLTEINAGESMDFEFVVIPGYELIYGWYTHNGARVGRDVFPGRRDSYTISVPTTLRAGRYILRMWVQKTGDRNYIGLGDFGFIVK